MDVSVIALDARGIRSWRSSSSSQPPFPRAAPIIDTSCYVSTLLQHHQQQYYFLKTQDAPHEEERVRKLVAVFANLEHDHDVQPSMIKPILYLI